MDLAFFFMCAVLFFFLLFSSGNHFKGELQFGNTKGSIIIADLQSTVQFTVTSCQNWLIVQDSRKKSQLDSKYRKKYLTKNLAYSNPSLPRSSLEKP